MAMVGLFWITEDSVYIGAEPNGTASAVRLTPDGVEALGTGHGTAWSWHQVRRLDVDDVPVRSPARRLLSVALDSLAVLVTGDGELPPAFTVRVGTETDTHEVSVLSAAVGGIYTTAEYDLSHELLRRLADGSASVGDLLAWRRDRADDTAPGREQGETLLRTWAAG